MGKSEAEASPHIVYRYDFEDGSAYVGRTKQKLRARHLAHIAKPVNRYLWHQLKRYPDVEPTLIGSYPTLTAATNAEKTALASLDKPLNAVWISTERFVPEGCFGRLSDNSPITWSLLGRDTRTGKTKIRNRRYPRVETGSYKCRTCYEHKPPQAYNADALRSTGIASRCRECSKYVSKMYRLYEIARRPQYAAYEDCVAAIRDGTIDEAIAAAEAAAIAAGHLPRNRRQVRGEGETLLLECLTCFGYKPIGEYHRRPGGYMGLTPQCKDCRRVINREMARAKAAGTCTSEAWHRAKAALAGGR